MGDSPYTADPETVRRASVRCTELFKRIMVSEAQVSSALQVPDILGALKDNVIRTHMAGESGLRELLSGVLIGFDPAKDLPGMAARFADLTALNIETVISGAVVVFSHSTADDVFTEVCWLAIDLDRNRWVKLINKDRQVSLRSVVEMGEAKVVEAELGSYKNELKSASLPCRAKLLFERVPIILNKKLPADSPRHFDEYKLKEADELRHGLVHRNGLSGLAPDSGDKFMGFLHEAAQTALRSLAHAYRFSLDNETFTSFFSPKSPAV